VAQEKAFVQEQAMVEEANRRPVDKVVLNVGGTTVATTRTTLCFCKESMLAAMFTDETRTKSPV